MSTYRSVLVSRFDEPGDVIEIGERERLPLASGEIRLACETVGLNFVNISLCRGAYSQVPIPPFTPGVQVAGRVIEAGMGAEGMLGLEVLACPALPRGALGDEVVIQASLAIDYTSEDVVAMVREATNGRGVDAVIDPVGGPMTDISLDCLAFEGHLVTIGAAGGASAIDPTDGGECQRGRAVLGSHYPWERPAEVATVYNHLFDLVSSGTVRPVTQRVVGLDQTAAALDDLANRRTTGKIIVKI